MIPAPTSFCPRALRHRIRTVAAPRRAAGSCTACPNTSECSSTAQRVWRRFVSTAAFPLGPALTYLQHVFSVVCLLSTGLALQDLHTDIDALLLDLDSNFGLAELVDEPAMTPTTADRLRTAASLQDQRPAGELSTAELAREAAATSAAAGRSRAAAAHAAQLMQRARGEMVSDRAKAAASAECAFTLRHARCGPWRCA